MPKISVIMGAYNIASLANFDHAMQSVLKQSETDFEFVICDDGSTDGTYDLLTEYARRDSRIKLIRNPQNQGLASALNHCLSVASGMYIARQDADDYSNQKRLKKQVSYLEEHTEIGFVGSNVLLFDETGIWGGRNFPEYPKKKDFLFTAPFVHGSLLFRSETLKAAGGYRVAKETRRTEDYELQMRLYANGVQGANLQEPLYEFCEDVQALKRRKYQYRVDEAIVRWKGFCRLGLMPQAFPYVVKPLLVGLIPQKILMQLKDGRTLYRNKTK